MMCRWVRRVLLDAGMARVGGLRTGVGLFLKQKRGVKMWSVRTILNICRILIIYRIVILLSLTMDINQVLKE